MAKTRVVKVKREAPSEAPAAKSQPPPPPPKTHRKSQTQAQKHKHKRKHTSKRTHGHKLASASLLQRMRQHRTEECRAKMHGILKRVVKQGQVSNKATSALATLAERIVEQLCQRAAAEHALQGRRAVTAQDVMVSARLCLPERLYQLATQRGVVEIAEARGNTEPLRALFAVKNPFHPTTTLQPKDA